MISEESRKIVKKALSLAEKNIGKTYPNPSVACILADKNNNIVSLGVTGHGGRPHAEIVAIRKVDNRDEVENLYVTLEPCCHYGVTEPCINEILKLRNLKNIFICTRDPYFKVNGRSIDLLRKNNINVFLDVEKENAILLNQGFFSCQILSRPMISVKIATSLDGKIACHNGQSKWITNERSRNYVQKIRSQYDCILTTNQTILKDNPSLNVRYPKIPKYQPIRVVVDRDFSLAGELENLNIYKTGGGQRTIILTKKNAENMVKNFENIEFVKLQTNNLLEIFEILKNLGITRVLVESGGKFITSLLKEDLVDKFYWFQSNKIIGNDGIASMGDLNLQNVEECKYLKLMNVKRFDDDMLKILINEENFCKISCHF